MKNKKNVIFLLFKAFTTFLMILNVTNIKNDSLIIFLFFVLVFGFYYKNDYKNFFKVEKKNIYVLFSILISFSQILGSLVYKYQFSRDVSVIRSLLTIDNFINIVGLFFLIYTLLVMYVPKLLNINIFSKERKYSDIKFFSICFLVIFICWIPYFLTLYPGILTADSISQFSSFIDGFNIISDHHPVIHTLLIGIIYKIGYFLFHSVNIATSFVAFVQMMIMASIFSYFCVWLHKRNVSKNILLLVLMYFSLSPLHGYYSVTMWKDILFSGFFLLFVLNVIDIDQSKCFSIKNIIKFIVLSLLILFFRNNALYVYLFCIPFLIYIYKNKLFNIILCICISLTGYFFVKGPVFNHFNIKKSSSSEYIAIPLQQVGRMAYKFVDFTDDEISIINELIPVDAMADLYNPINVDFIKFNPLYNVEVFDNNKSKYLKLWFNLVLEHPSIAIESYLNSTLGYWYSGVEYWATGDSVDKNDLGIYSSSHGGKYVNSYVRKIVSRNIPIVSMQWSIGLCFILIAFSCFLIIIQNKKRLLVYYIPVIGVWLTLMVASPVFAEFRYVYCAYTCLPLFLLIPFLELKSR